MSLADDATQALERHVKGDSGLCRGCLKLFRKPVPWPCKIVSLANLALKIEKGQMNE